MKNITTLCTLFYRRITLLVLITLLSLLTAFDVAAQDPPGPGKSQTHMANMAPVIIDGGLVVQLRGVSSYPATERAKRVRSKIIEAASDDSFSVESIRIEHLPDRSAIFAGDKLLLSLFVADAEIEDLDRKLLAEVTKEKIVAVINTYREGRSTKYLLKNSSIAVGLTVVLALLLWVILKLFRKLEAWAIRHVQKSVEDLASKSHHLIRANQIWTLVAGFLSMVRVVAVVILVYSYLNTALGLFPWTRPAALALFGLVLNPLKSLWEGFVISLPDLAFLVVLFLVLRYVLKLTRMFFNQVAWGRIKLSNFDPDWALPTHKIIRFLIIAFSVVIAYPYIPGSDSLAFKGVSVFIGVIFSLGSSSFISNMLAGLAMTYRGAFKVGDRVKIGEVIGNVEGIKLMTTRVNTVKNESVVIPNSNILNTDVTNYSVLAREEGLVMHTTVSIGYDTPWRQVEAMLLIAAERTQGLQKEPAPFVLQTSMGDFAVSYEINAYCTEVHRLLAIKSDLHRNIQDIFNQHGVQIMSPAYEHDPQTPKIVPPEDWYTAPASKPE
jgi:small-conductance mechanosensitive channel